MTTEDRIQEEANSFCERYWANDYLLEPELIELLISERSKTIDEVTAILNCTNNPDEYQSFEMMLSKIEQLKVTTKK